VTQRFERLRLGDVEGVVLVYGHLAALSEAWFEMNVI
jgi:hypothetical protein